MRELTQTILSDLENNINGNCFITCVSMMLGTDITDWPNWDYPESWDDFNTKIVDKLMERGFELNIFMCDDMDLIKEDDKLDGYMIAVGTTNRSTVIGHACIYKDNKLVYDPHPDKTGLKTVRGFFSIIKLEEEIKELDESI